ncbi:hypothetical protein KQX54_003147 [Cotesia glomerata]|uniref:Uncharacterized protein n=1 Tax=Cotesia glomerata TaxID=32391 RepID=A0AAV7I7U4_COTGL|nr:hypothetical protein KQX54_003147 [Cotesia glomerata]
MRDANSDEINLHVDNYDNKNNNYGEDNDYCWWCWITYYLQYFKSILLNNDTVDYKHGSLIRCADQNHLLICNYNYNNSSNSNNYSSDKFYRKWNRWRRQSEFVTLYDNYDDSDNTQGSNLVTLEFGVRLNCTLHWALGGG